MDYTPQNNLAVILPSLDPDTKFTGVVNGLIGAGYEHIVIIDDGSDSEHQRYFTEAERFSQCTVIHHGVNRGKGRALKTAFSYVHEHMPELSGVITIDGDGQHLLEDITACGRKLLENPGRVIMGCRDFSQPGVPPRSVAGNISTSRMFKLLFGIKLSDTQTGLRAIPSEYLELFSVIEGERFEYETNMLLQMNREGIEFIEQPIQTVYDPDDYSSHYNAFRDSARVGGVMLKFLISGSGFRYICSAVASWAIDTGIYYALLSLFGLRLKSAFQIIGNLSSSVFNFNINKFWVFRKKDSGSYGKELLEYYCIAIPRSLIGTALTTAVQNLANADTPGIATVFKIAVEAAMFFVTYFLQKKWVFKK